MINLEAVKCKLFRKEDTSELQKLLNYTFENEVKIIDYPEYDNLKDNQQLLLTDNGYVLFYIKKDEETNDSFFDYCGFLGFGHFLDKHTMIVIDLDGDFEAVKCYFCLRNTENGEEHFSAKYYRIFVINYDKYLKI